MFGVFFFNDLCGYEICLKIVIKDSPNRRYGFSESKKMRELKISYALYENFDSGQETTNLNYMRACFVYMRAKLPPTVSS